VAYGSFFCKSKIAVVGICMFSVTEMCLF